MINAGKSSASSGGKIDEKLWILDTWATHRMTGCIELLTDIHNITPLPVTLPAGSNACATKQGTIQLTPRLRLQNVFFVDGFHTNLISFGQLVKDSFLIGQVTDKLVILQDRTTRMLIGAGEQEREGLYRIEMVTSLKSSLQTELVLWHNRMGHPSSHVTGIISEDTNTSRSRSEHLFTSCDVCFPAKQTRQCFPSSSSKAKEVFDLIHVDLWGPYRTTAFCGSRYFLTIVDDCSRAVWLYLLPDKTLVSQQIRNFIAMIDRQFSRKVKVNRSDNGTEFMCLSAFFREQGIIHETSCVYTPQQNGCVERKHRHILNVARALRFQASLPIEYWGECVLAAGYLINRTPSVVLQNKTPFEVLYGHAPGYKHIRVMGCLAYAHNFDHKGDKFTSRSRRCVFLGYPYGKKGWRLFDLEREVVFTSRDVVFQETVFPLAAPNQQKDVTPVLSRNEPTMAEFDSDPDNETTLDAAPESLSSEDDRTETTAPTTSESVSPVAAESSNSQSSDLLGRGHRTKKTSVKLCDYVVDALTAASCSTSLVSLSPSPEQ